MTQNNTNDVMDLQTEDKDGNQSTNENPDKTKSDVASSSPVTNNNVQSTEESHTVSNQLYSSEEHQAQVGSETIDRTTFIHNSDASSLISPEPKDRSSSSVEESVPMETNSEQTVSQSEGGPQTPNNTNDPDQLERGGAHNIASQIESDSENKEKQNDSHVTTANHKEVENKLKEAIQKDCPQPYKTSYNIEQNKSWLDLQFHNQQEQNGVVKPNEIQNIPDAPISNIDETLLNRIKGSMIGMALGDALGAHVEFRPHSYLEANPVTDLGSGGTWGLEKGQFTDDTSMALCLANSLISCQDFVPYDQLVRYRWWYQHGYMSSTGQCFDIGNATRESVQEFTNRQQRLAKELKLTDDQIDHPSNHEVPDNFKVYCSTDGVAGNGALMRLAPVPLFFFRSPINAVEYSGVSGQITHGDQKSYDACRYYGALIVAALFGFDKDHLLDDQFYSKYRSLFGNKELHKDIKDIAEGSYKRKNGYKGGIRGTGYIVNALEAALWAFYSTKTFEEGALAAVNLGDDTDTTAAIYGQLAGAFYRYEGLPKKWTKHVYAPKFLEKLSEWIAYEGDQWFKKKSEEMRE